MSGTSTEHLDALANMAPDVPPHHHDEANGLDDRGELRVIPGILVSSSLRNRKRWIAMAALATVIIHAGFAGLFLLLLDFRDLPDLPEKAIPVEIVTAIPESPKPKPPAATAASAPGPTPSPSPPPSDSPAPPPFVAPPPETTKADAEPVDKQPATVSSDAVPKPDQPASPPPAAPAVLSAEAGGFSVAPAAPPPTLPATTPSTKERDAVAAKLAQALPMDLSTLPSTFRAVLSAQGSEVNFEYKGVVFGRLQRAHAAMEAARQRHLHGRVVVSFSVDEGGRAIDLKITGSSGTPAVDDLAIAMVREAEPFPPPPSGAKQVFTPGLIVGDEDE